MPSIVPSITLLEDSSFIVLARILGVDGAAAQQADISSITRTVWDVTGGAAVTGHDAAAETVSSVIFDTLQTESDDALWTVDGTGYNFKKVIDHTALETGNNEYSLEFKFVDANSNEWFARWRIDTEPVYST